MREDELQSRQDGYKDNTLVSHMDAYQARMNSHHEEMIIVMKASLEEMEAAMKINQKEVKAIYLEPNPKEI
jgi:hypothetical protein